MSPRKLPPDQAHRDRAIAARGLNVLVDAGAGTGKTTLLVKRLVEIVAPPDDGPALLLSRLAAVTFTRKAAGELRLRVRERLLGDLSGPCSVLRRERLVRALADSDTAFIGTIHGFADRLLRMKPVEARLSPSYGIVEDADALCRETFELLLQAAEAGRLAEELEGTGCDPGRASEAEEVIRDALAAEVRAESEELEWMTRHGLDSLFSGFILHRDVPPPLDARPANFPLARVQERVKEFRALALASHGNGAGSRWMASAASQLERIEGLSDRLELYRQVGLLLRFAPGGAKLQKKRDFPGDDAGWDAWKVWRGEKDDPGHRDLIARPLHRWMATRLVRAFPAVVAMYEKVKARYRAADQVDLLLRLRDLLRDRPAARADLQRLFDHVFVDEFQDTDPLQAEIVLFLCEDGAKAEHWDAVALAPGKLTLVGDPKQSIYRFRRADISVYEAVRGIVMKGQHLLVPLTANFRSEPALIEHLNARFDEILGAPAAGKPGFDAASGTVLNQHLDQGRAGTRKACVKVLPYSTGQANVDSDRAREAELLATWIRATVEGQEEVADPATGEQRPVRYGDIAVLAHTTTNVGLLIEALDRLGVPWSARGGKLFLEDPLHRQFLLGLRAVADRHDGVALAALLRAPFFALDLADLVRAQAAEKQESDEGIDRAREAERLLWDLARRRFERPPGETARDLLDLTGLARAAALGPNGLQRLGRLRELCFELERIAAAEGLDYDGATARLREWAVAPVGLDPPRPVGTDAVQIMTIHQAKGLEFPAVVWWDAHARLAPRDPVPPWFVERSGAAWAMGLDQLAAEEPPDGGLFDREKLFQAAERRRLVYVAATRARDLLVLPVTLSPGGDFATNALRGGTSPALAVEDAWTDEGPPAWAKKVKAPPARKARVNEPLTREVESSWLAAGGEAAKPRFVPRGVAAEAHGTVERAAEGEAGAPWKVREGRFGPVFGETVHRAIGVALRDPALAPAEAVARAARATDLGDHLAEAAEDVARALTALEREGLRRAPGEDLRLEYPVAASREGTLLFGYIDLLAARGGKLLVLDFKTDAPPSGDVKGSHPVYVEQVQSYGRILVELGLAREGSVRCGLLFTGDGGLRWV